MFGHFHNQLGAFNNTNPACGLNQPTVSVSAINLISLLLLVLVVIIILTIRCGPPV